MSSQVSGTVQPLSANIGGSTHTKDFTLAPSGRRRALPSTVPWFAPVLAEPLVDVVGDLRGASTAEPERRPSPEQAGLRDVGDVGRVAGLDADHQLGLELVGAPRARPRRRCTW